MSMGFVWGLWWAWGWSAGWIAPGLKPLLGLGVMDGLKPVPFKVKGLTGAEVCPVQCGGFDWG
ncbi:MAG: hypothetical protein HIU91_01445 [Acidobacteria bacterium]|nr:hypothetical protein [Acidobacteriota bacterium]